MADKDNKQGGGATSQVQKQDLDALEKRLKASLMQAFGEMLDSKLQTQLTDIHSKIDGVAEQAKGLKGQVDQLETDTKTIRGVKKNCE